MKMMYKVNREMKPSVFFTSKQDAIDYLLSIGYAYYQDMKGYFKPIDGGCRGYYQAWLRVHRIIEGDEQ